MIANFLMIVFVVCIAIAIGTLIHMWNFDQPEEDSDTFDIQD